MSKMPWEMSSEEVRVASGAMAPPPPAPKEDTNKKPWEMVFDEIRQFFSPSKPAVVPQQNTVSKPKPAPQGFDMRKYINTVAAVESSGNPNAKAKTSSATGLFQFTAGTWRDMTRELGVEYTLEDRKDPEKAKHVMEAFTAKNLEKARNDLQREPTQLEAYLYHFAGRSAPKLIKADPEDLAINHVTKAQAKANQSVFYKDGKPVKVGDVLERFGSKFNGVVSQKEMTEEGKEYQRDQAISGRFSKYRLKLLKETAGLPEYGQIIDFLADRRAIPDIQVGRTDGANAVFEYPNWRGGFLDAAGKINVAPVNFYTDGKLADGARGTLIHELTHAAERQMKQLAYAIEKKGPKATPEEKQFLNSFDKSIYGVKDKKDNRYKTGAMLTAEAMDKEWSDKQRKYRSTSGELLAFGTGNATDKTKTDSYEPPPHLNQTVATEFMILLDQARKASKQSIKGGR